MRDKISDTEFAFLMSQGRRPSASNDGGPKPAIAKTPLGRMIQVTQINASMQEMVRIGKLLRKQIAEEKARTLAEGPSTEEDQRARTEPESDQ